jgi:hypothetical protein
MPLPGHDWVKQKWKVMHSEGLPSYHIAVSLTVLLPAGSSKENETDRAYVPVQALGDPTSKSWSHT